MKRVSWSAWDGFESSRRRTLGDPGQAHRGGGGRRDDLAYPPGSGLVSAADMPDYQDDARTVLTEAITEMCTIDTDVVVRPRVVEGQAGPVLVEVAEGADLLVVGNRGHGGLAEALLGSVGQYCVRQAPCPVVIRGLGAGRDVERRARQSQRCLEFAADALQFARCHAAAIGDIAGVQP